VLGVVDTGTDPDYVTAAASRDRLELANEAARYTTSMRRRVAGGCITQYTRPIDSFTPQDDAMSGVPLLWKGAKESAQNISEAKLHCTLRLPAGAGARLAAWMVGINKHEIRHAVPHLLHDWARSLRLTMRIDRLRPFHPIDWHLVSARCYFRDSESV
jgi:hypothetical protein